MDETVKTMVGSRIAVVSRTPRYFAAGQLAIALGAEIYAIDNSCTEFTENERAIEWRGEAIDCHHLIVVGVAALRMAARSIASGCYKTVGVIFSDTACCVDRKWWNRFVRTYRIPVYMMPDLAQYSKVDYIPCFQTMSIRNVDIVKVKRLTICHSPNQKGIYKGTPAIRRAIADLKDSFDFDYVEIVGRTWQDTLAIKGKAHIFIDQLTYLNPEVPQSRFGGQIPYHGALGKSGIEGMLLKCCTITGAKEVKTEPWFPTPPVYWIRSDELKSTLIALMKDRGEMTAAATRQYEWARKYTSSEYVAAHVTRHIREGFVFPRPARFGGFTGFVKRVLCGVREHQEP